jgi:hypothetical protein
MFSCVETNESVSFFNKEKRTSARLKDHAKTEKKGNKKKKRIYIYVDRVLCVSIGESVRRL